MLSIYPDNVLIAPAVFLDGKITLMNNFIKVNMLGRTISFTNDLLTCNFLNVKYLNRVTSHLNSKSDGKNECLPEGPDQLCSNDLLPAHIKLIDKATENNTTIINLPRFKPEYASTPSIDPSQKAKQKPSLSREGRVTVKTVLNINEYNPKKLISIQFVNKQPLLQSPSNPNSRSEKK